MNHNIIIAWVYHLMADSILPISMSSGSTISGLKPVGCGLIANSNDKGSFGINWDIVCFTFCISSWFISSAQYSVIATIPTYIVRPTTSSINVYMSAIVSQENVNYTNGAISIGSLAINGTLTPYTYTHSISYILYKLDT